MVGASFSHAIVCARARASDQRCETDGSLAGCETQVACTAPRKTTTARTIRFDSAGGAGKILAHAAAAHVRAPWESRDTSSAPRRRSDVDSPQRVGCGERPG